MNIRFDEKSIRFRLTMADCAYLLQHGSLAFTLRLGEGAVEYIVSLKEDGEMDLQATSTCYQLMLPRNALQVLYNQAPSKEYLSCGYVTAATSLMVYLEIDVRRSAK